jgi:hypothetical protein
LPTLPQLTNRLSCGRFDRLLVRPSVGEPVGWCACRLVSLSNQPTALPMQKVRVLTQSADGFTDRRAAAQHCSLVFVRGSQTFMRSAQTFVSASLVFVRSAQTFQSGLQTFVSDFEAFVRGLQTFVSAAQTFVKPLSTALSG